jgi:hypothetical protein
LAVPGETTGSPECCADARDREGWGSRAVDIQAWYDANVLIYAFRKDTAHHAVCKSWLDGLVAGDSQFGISPLVLSAVARITTNPQIFRQPSPADEVFAYCNNLLGQPHCAIVRPGERHWTIFERLCMATGSRGPRI